MTIDAIERSTSATLSAADVADILGCDPQTLRLMAIQQPDALAPLQPIRLGNRVRFPRLRFLGWYFGQYTDTKK